MATESNGNSDGDVWQVTVAHGKQTHVVVFHPQHPQRLSLLKLEVETFTGVAAKHQRLLYRGKELLDDGANATTKRAPPPLMNNAKLMLLLNQAYHQDAAKRPVSSASSAAAADTQASSSSSQEEVPFPVEKRQKVSIDIDSLDDDEVLVQAFRGKANYELILKRDDAVLTVKEHVSGILGLSAQGIRLVVKGKTPQDETRLYELLGSGAQLQSIKCMVLLQAQQHVVMEKEDDLRQLLNELTQLQVDARRIEKQVARNFASREETMVRMGALVDGAKRVHGNLGLLLAHLAPSGGGLAMPRVNKQTTDLLVKAIQDSHVLCGLCEALLQRLTLL